MKHLSQEIKSIKEISSKYSENFRLNFQWEEIDFELSVYCLFIDTDHIMFVKNGFVWPLKKNCLKQVEIYLQ